MTDGREKTLADMLRIIARHPGVRPRDLNRMLGMPHTAGLRKTLLARGLIRKERRGPAVHYYCADRR